MIIFSDPHLGLNRKSHTIKGSSEALKNSIALQFSSFMQNYFDESIVCAGDLFDTFSNTEQTILKAYPIADKCDVILAGNHDLKNTTDSVSSLDLLQELCPGTTIVKPEKFEEPFILSGRLDRMDFLFIPHQGSQAIFDDAVAMACDEGGMYSESGKFRAVFLHCNYDNDLANNSDASLNITSEQVDKLLEFCDYVFIGHEHHPAKLKGGRLIIIGNPHPTSFSDISNKYVYLLTEDDLEVIEVWSEDTGYLKVNYDPAEEIPVISDGVGFIDIEGEIESKDAANLSRYIAQIWKESEAFMVRNKVSIKLSDRTVINSSDVQSLPDTIAKKLKGSDMEPVWGEYWRKLKC